MCIDVIALSGLRPIHIVTDLGDVKFLNTLLAAGADINAVIDNEYKNSLRANRGFTALHLAIFNGDLEMTTHLLRRGADIHIKTPGPIKVFLFIL
jgi:ankyrin repeat protein